MKHSPETIKESLRRCAELRGKYWDVLPEELKWYVRRVEVDGKASKLEAKRARKNLFRIVTTNAIGFATTMEYKAMYLAVTACASRNNSLIWLREIDFE